MATSDEQLTALGELLYQVYTYISSFDKLLSLCFEI